MKWTLWLSQMLSLCVASMKVMRLKILHIKGKLCAFRYYSYFIVSSKVAFKILNFIYHTIPACFMDLMALALSKKMIYRRAYEKTEKILIIMSYFGLREWKVGNNNVQAMAEKTKNFKNRLDFDMRNVNWREYFSTFIPGIKRHFFKENTNDSTRMAAQYQWYMSQVQSRKLYQIFFLSFLPQDATCSCHIEIFDLCNPHEKNVENSAVCDAHRDVETLY